MPLGSTKMPAHSMHALRVSSPNKKDQQGRKGMGTPRHVNNSYAPMRGVDRYLVSELLVRSVVSVAATCCMDSAQPLLDSMHSMQQHQPDTYLYMTVMQTYSHMYAHPPNPAIAALDIHH
eukprot:GHUV01027036.1.p1 GENE.GHUV01027036.1~~GHUV01027036.1.p1  ORF type:complete len:120 (-),score=0.83 GHUV01027036.1:1242-1601(-)